MSNSEFNRNRERTAIITNYDPKLIYEAKSKRFQGSAISNHPRKKAILDCDRTRKDKDFVGNQILARRYCFDTGTKKIFVTIPTRKVLHLTARWTNREWANISWTKRAQEIDFKLPEKLSKSVPDIPTQRHHQILKSCSSLTTGSIWTKFFTRGTYFLTGNMKSFTARTVCKLFGTGCDYSQKKL